MQPDPKNQSTLILLGEDHSGRDEMNLAGNPFALLQAASKAGQSLIHYEWDRTLPSGKIVKASWEVNGHTVLGLPGPNEELLYLVLLQLTREMADGGEWPRQLHFSRLDVIRRLGWSDNAASYRTLTECFIRLVNVTINARHAFWNARGKSPYEAVSFGLIDDFGIAAEPRGRKGQGALPLSWIRWNETLHESFLAGNVRSLALDFVLGLETPTSRRLFRLLDMMRHGGKPPRREFQIGVMKLRDRLGMTGYKHNSKVKEKLAGAHAELIRRGYLADVSFRKNDAGEEIATYRFGDVRISAIGDQGRGGVKPNDPRKATLQPGSLHEDKALPPTETSDAGSIYPIEAHAVFTALPDADQERLRLWRLHRARRPNSERFEQPRSGPSRSHRARRGLRHSGGVPIAANPPPGRRRDLFDDRAVPHVFRFDSLGALPSHLLRHRHRRCRRAGLQRNGAFQFSNARSGQIAARNRARLSARRVSGTARLLDNAGSPAHVLKRFSEGLGLPCPFLLADQGCFQVKPGSSSPVSANVLAAFKVASIRFIS